MIELDTFDPLVFVCDVVVVVFCERRLYRIVLLDEDPPPVKGFAPWWCLVGMFLVSSLYERERERERER